MKKRIFITGTEPDQLQAVSKIVQTQTDLIPIHAGGLGLDFEEYKALVMDLLSICDLVCVMPGLDETFAASVARDAGLPVIELDKVRKEFGRVRG